MKDNSLTTAAYLLIAISYLAALFQAINGPLGTHQLEGALSYSLIALHGGGIFLFHIVFFISKKELTKSHAKYMIISFWVMMITTLCAIMFAAIILNKGEMVSSIDDVLIMDGMGYLVLAGLTSSLVTFWYFYRNIRALINYISNQEMSKKIKNQKSKNILKRLPFFKIKSA